MTLTEHDVRTLLQSPVDPATADRVLDAVLAARRPARRSARRPAPARRPWRIGLVTALAVVMVAGAVLAVVTARPGHRAAPGPAVASTPAPSVMTSAPAAPVALRVDSSVVSFRAGSPYRAGLTTLFADEESVDAAAADGTTAATVHVGQGPLPTVVLGPPVDIGGGTSAVQVQVPGGEGVTPLGNGLAWTVAGLTVTVSPNFDGATDADVEAVARAVVIGPPAPVRVPVSATAWPAGWTLDGLVSSYAHRDGPGGTAGRDVLVDLSLPGQDGTAVTIDSAGLAYGPDDSTGPTVVIDGRTWTWDAASRVLVWAGPDRFVRLATVNDGVGQVQLQALAALLTLAPAFGDETTWFDSTTALPSS